MTEERDVQFLRLREVALRLGIPRTRIYELAKAGKIPTVSLTGNHSLRVPLRWLEELERQALARLRPEGDPR